jgi:hypothetical protein
MPATVSSAQLVKAKLAECQISVPDFPENTQLANSDRINPVIAASSVINGRTARAGCATSINVAKIKETFFTVMISSPYNLVPQED